MNMKFYRKLPIPQEIKKEYPISAGMIACKKRRDESIRKIFTGEDRRFLLVIGPCSADRIDAVTEYMGRLRRVADQVCEKIVMIPRLYTNKPRTTGDGYKGILHQPDPAGHPDMLRGIVATRELHMRALRDYGFTCADEMLYPDNHRYVSDLLSYVTVGARSVENQEHRLTASGLDIPVGMKNPTGGDLNIMMNAIHAAQNPHTFIYRGWEVQSEGNPLTHAILRGWQGREGNRVSNYHYEDLLKVNDLYVDSGLTNRAVLVDTNHSNSGKRYEEQIRIAHDVLRTMRQSDIIRSLVKGLMIESYLVDGCQTVTGEVFGQSITDPCLGWEKTEKLIFEIADRL